jgi:Family of unknown function (DUF6152)
MNKTFGLSVGKAVVVAIAAIAGAAHAHHGGGTFDRNSSVDYQGTITGVDFVNPHAWVYFDVVNGAGEVEHHRCEMRSATVLKRSGWSEAMFAAGTAARIEGRGDRIDPFSCYLTTITFADGSSADRYGQLRKADLSSSERPLRLANGEPNISGDWAPEQLVMTDPRGRGGALVPLSTVEQFAPGEGSIGDPTQAGQGGARQYRTRAVTLTEAGQAAADAFGTYDPEDNPRMRCETTSILFDWTFDGPVNRITQAGDVIRVQYGQLGLERTIHMDLTSHPSDLTPSRAGHSIGHWENDVLVVDTVGFAPGVLSPPVLNSDRLHVVERFALDPRTMTLSRSYVATDPVYYVDEYVGEDSLQIADIPYGPDMCRELTFVDYSEVQE